MSERFKTTVSRAGQAALEQGGELVEEIKLMFKTIDLKVRARR